MKVRTIVCDLDDTLYKESEYVVSGIHAASRWLKQERGVDGFGAIAQAIFERGVRNTIFNETLSALGLKDDASLVSNLVAAYRLHEPTLSLLPDAVTLLDWAKGKYQLALLTDGYLSVQTAKISALSLDKIIECRVLTDRWGRDSWKPSTSGFQRVMEHFGGVGEDYVYIGDNPRKDFIGPTKLGWHTVRIRRDGYEHATYQPSAAEASECTISDLNEIASIIETV